MARKSQSTFENPGEDAAAPAPTDNEINPGFEAPADESALAAEAADSEASALLAGIDAQLLAAKAAIEQVLGQLSADEEGIQSAAASDHNVVGVGIGIGSPSSAYGTAAPGDPVLEVYTIEPESVNETRARLADTTGASALSSTDFPMQCVCTGIIDAFPHRFRDRPAPGGISVGHVAITAGTLGCLARGRRAPRNNRLMVLSNNHVLANSNAAALGQPIIQPGPADGGIDPRDRIALLERFVPIVFGGAANFVDCATGWAWPALVRREMVHVPGGVRTYFRIGSTPVAAAPGLRVGKSGRTTQLTSGSVTAIGVTINVNYGGGRIARFLDQVAVRAGAGNFSAGGDSGSLIWTWDARRAPVALLFAGGGGTTFGNRIGRVLTALDINLVT